MKREAVALAFLGAILLVVSFLPDPFFLTLLRALVMMLGAYSLYIAKKVWELEKGFNEAVRVGEKIKKKLDELQVS
ncbi:hypothetical protein [Ignicoccus hospitalis]|uniref:Uncharacterized protein n=1 Tax=Ignicoccus hospitalis (strain KIN4/I / DSM 18386 / JCM 14125) TaxID=453591 RepID=A8AB45_IGNH4|nr:hypothetical protein [Ignicoccus hospitalis]ABU82147.1 hypothetical protein Igni_0967 [Ignicoccus hospitalis KIN4/I]HIH91104.1 hypothetical protein [Desulfurococcaceae archaeon]